MTDLIRIAYASAATPAFKSASVPDLLARARKKNGLMDVTGILLEADRSFFQILEGAPSVLDALYEKILHDPRHARIVKLIEEPITQRDFADWSMGLARLTPKELSTLTGLNDFFGAGSALHKLSEGTARKLLSGFRDGRWRATVAA